MILNLTNQRGDRVRARLRAALRLIGLPRRISGQGCRLSTSHL